MNSIICVRACVLLYKVTGSTDYGCLQVCLSLLGTFHGGDESSKWNPQYSSLFQLMMSVQTQIFTPDPYFNEPVRVRACVYMCMRFIQTPAGVFAHSTAQGWYMAGQALQMSLYGLKMLKLR